MTLKEAELEVERIYAELRSSLPRFEVIYRPSLVAKFKDVNTITIPIIEDSYLTLVYKRRWKNMIVSTNGTLELNQSTIVFVNELYDSVPQVTEICRRLEQAVYEVMKLDGKRYM